MNRLSSTALIAASVLTLIALTVSASSTAQNTPNSPNSPSPTSPTSSSNAASPSPKVTTGRPGMRNGQSPDGDKSAAATAGSPAPVSVPAPSTSTSPSPSVPDKYQPTHEQAQEIEIIDLKAQLAQSQYASKAQSLPEFATFQQWMNQLRQACEKVRVDNKWPATVQCDMQQYPVRWCEQLPCGAANTVSAPTVAPTPTPVGPKK